MSNILTKIKEFYQNTVNNTGKEFNDFQNNQYVQKIYRFFTNTDTFKHTLFLAVFYVFLFYLPFTYLTLFFHKIIFFQGDYVQQFSSIIFDFRNKIMHLDFSTWDWKNTFGYDYAADLYYIPLDFSLLPYFLFPFLAASSQMWLSFLLKVLVGTGVFAYLLKLYHLNHKTIIFSGFLYGTADLFFSWNVFPSFTGLIVYIPLILVAIELMIRKKWYWFFSLVIFQTILFNFYWAWSLTLFMAIALLIRSLYQYVHRDNLFKPKTYGQLFLFLITVFVYYLIGIGMSAFVLGPVLNIMQNEPRMSESGGFSLIDILNNLTNFKALFSHHLGYYASQFITYFKDHPYAYEFNKMVYYRVALKMLIPNIYEYSGWFFDNTQGNEFYATNMAIIYSSIMASFTVLQFIFYPSFIAKKKLNGEQYKIYTLLQVITILTTLLMLIPAVGYVFSLTPIPYVRWYIFAGVLFIINLAFLIEYNILNRWLFFGFLIISIGYLFYSIRANSLPTASKNGNADEGIVYIYIVAYAVMIVFLLIFPKLKFPGIFILIERIAFAGTIVTLMISPYFTSVVAHADDYPAAVNKIMKNVTLKDENYYTMMDFLFGQDDYDAETNKDTAYLYTFPVYDNVNIFHSLINPYFDIYNPSYDTTHYRAYDQFNYSYFYYMFIDPSLIIESNTENYNVSNAFQPPASTLIGSQEFPDLHTNIKVYENTPNFSIGMGYTNYYQPTISGFYGYANYNLPFYDLYLRSFYAFDSNTVQMLQKAGFTAGSSNINDLLGYAPVSVDPNYNAATDFPNPYFAHTTKLDVNVTSAQATAILLSTNSPVFAEYGDGSIHRCFNTFCFVPDSGIKALIGSMSTSTAYVRIVNPGVMQQDIDALKKNSTYDVHIKGNSVTAKINNSTPLIMQFKIGYAQGWTAYVDGKEVPVFPSELGTLSFILKTTGVQTIHLVYKTPKLASGIKISVISLVVLAAAIPSQYYLRKYVKARRSLHVQTD